MGESPPRDVERDLWEHVEELVVRARRVAIAIVVFTVAFAVVPYSLSPYTPLAAVFPRLFLDHVVPERIEVLGSVIEVKLFQSSPFGGLGLVLKTSVLMGVLASSPVIAWETYQFVKPALYPHEERLIKALGAASILLFLVGALLAYMIIVPLTFRIMFIASAVVVGDRLAAFADVGSLLSSAIIIIVALGFTFETPIIVYALVRAGILSPELFTGDNARILLVGALLVGAVISPDPTGLGMLLIAIPFYTLILLGAKLGARHRRQTTPTPKMEETSPA